MPQGNDNPCRVTLKRFMPSITNMVPLKIHSQAQAVWAREAPRTNSEDPTAAFLGTPTPLLTQPGFRQNHRRLSLCKLIRSATEISILTMNR
jgi:hypothetical protein